MRERAALRRCPARSARTTDTLLMLNYCDSCGSARLGRNFGSSATWERVFEFVPLSAEARSCRLFVACSAVVGVKCCQVVCVRCCQLRESVGPDWSSVAGWWIVPIAGRRGGWLPCRARGAPATNACASRELTEEIGAPSERYRNSPRRF